MMNIMSERQHDLYCAITNLKEYRQRTNYGIVGLQKGWYPQRDKELVQMIERCLAKLCGITTIQAHQFVQELVELVYDPDSLKIVKEN